MTLLPVVRRELSVAARQRHTFWGRSGAALVAMVIGGWIYLIERASAFSGLGMLIFSSLSGLCFFYCMMAGSSHSSDCISAEKRDGTLGLLFLTDLRSYDIVLGKLAASSISALYRVMAVLPVIAIGLLMGGVTPGEYWRMVCVLLVTLGFSLGAGMLASVLSVESKRATGFAFLLVVCGSGLVPLIYLISSWWLKSRGLLDGEMDRMLERLFIWESPVVAFFSSFSSFPQANRWMFWPSLLWTLGLGLMFLGVACIRLPTCWQENGVETWRDRWFGRLTRWWHGGGAHLQTRRTLLLELSPICWLNERRFSRSTAVWWMIGLACLAFMGLGRQIGFRDITLLMLVSMVVHAILKFWIASEAPRRFADDRRSGALELYLCTSMSTGQLIAGQLRSLQRQFLGPILFVLMVDVWFAVTHSESTNFGEGGLLFWALRMLYLPVDAMALGYVGIWLSLAQSSRRLTGGVLGRVLIIPWLVLGAGGTAVAAFDWLDGVDNGQWLLMGAWFMVSMANNGYWIWRARLELNTRFREMAAVPLGSKSSNRWWPWRPRENTEHVSN